MNIDGYTINELQRDEFGRPNGILLIDKPKGLTSHDIVDQVRKKLGTRKVGHAGTLDPFASGLLVLLVGKATKLSDTFLYKDKTYKAEILLGKATDSGDPEGKIIDEQIVKARSIEDYQKTISSFEPFYNQYVPVFSSVKVKGEKLRVLARKYNHFKITGSPKKVTFFDKNNEKKQTVDLPFKEVRIYNTKIDSIDSDNEKVSIEVIVECSKGTYIRQLAVDFGEKLNQPSMLTNLRRIKIGTFKVEDSMPVSDLV